MIVQEFPYKNLSLEDIEGEEWKDIPGLEMYFMISSYGRVKRLEYELEYSDGRVYIKPSKIIKPVLMKVPNAFVNDNIYFLHAGFTLFKRKYNFSIARLVYQCFIHSFDMKNDSIVILTKDRNGLNIRPSNLIKASVSQKQQRIFELHRREPLVIDKEAKQRAIAGAKLANNKQVTKYNIHGKKIETYQSVADAAEKTGISASHISSRARGTEFSAGGFIWRFGDAGEVDMNPVLETITHRKKANKEVFGKKVTQYEMSGKRVANFSTISDAAKAIGVSNSDISLAINGKGKSAGGFFWKEGQGPSFIDLSRYEYGEALRTKNRQRAICQYSKEGMFLRKFESIRKAAEAIGVHSTTVLGALKGKQKTAGGYKWEYL